MARCSQTRLDTFTTPPAPMKIIPGIYSTGRVTLHGEPTLCALVLMTARS